MTGWEARPTDTPINPVRLPLACTNEQAAAAAKFCRMLADVAISESVAQWANNGLVWIGFGSLAGLLAKTVMPGRNPGGPIATLMVGIGGTCIGLGVLTYFAGGARITPISPLGFVAAC